MTAPSMFPRSSSSRLSARKAVLTAVACLVGVCGFAQTAAAEREVKLREVAIHYVGNGTGEGKIAVTINNKGEGEVTSFDVRLPVQTHAVVKNVAPRFKITGVEMALSYPHTGGGKVIPTYEPLRGWGGGKSANRERFDYQPLPGLNKGVANYAIERCKHALAAGSAGRHEMKAMIKILMRVTAAEGEIAWPIQSFLNEWNVVRRTAETSARINLECQAVSHFVNPDYTIDDFKVRHASNVPACPRPYQVSASFNRKPEVALAARKPVDLDYWLEVDGVKGERRSVMFRPQERDATISHEVKLDPGTHKLRIVLKEGQTTRIVERKVECGPLRLISSTLSYNQTGTCPKKVYETATFVFNQPGLTAYRIRHQGGKVVHTGNIEIKRDGDTYRAVGQRVITMGAFDGMMRAEIAGNDTAHSAWTPLNVTCAAVKTSRISIGKGTEVTCPKKVPVRAEFIADTSGGFRASIQCSNGFSDTKLLNAVKAGSVYKARMTVMTDIDKAQKLTCQASAPGFEPAARSSDTHVFNCGGPGTPSGLSGGATTPDDNAPRLKVSGDFSFIDRKREKTCPRDVKVLINFELNQNKDIGWSLDCMNAHTSGVAKAVKKDKGYIAPAMTTIALPEGQAGKAIVKCALKHVSPGPARVVKLKGKDFECRKRAVGPGVGGLSSGGAPQSSTQPPPAVRCLGGTVRGKSCICGPRMQVKRLGLASYACVAKITAPVRTNSDCKGVVRNGKCVTINRLGQNQPKFAVPGQLNNAFKPPKKIQGR